MICSQCGRENPPGARYCAYCAAALAPVPAATAYLPPSGPVRRTSGLAVASLVLGALGVLTVGLTGLVGLALGIAALIQISRSRGALQGEGLAIAGTIVSGLTILLFPVAAAILFPVFAQAREKARQRVCLSHEKLLGLSVSMYVQDYDEVLPRRDNWCDATLPYTRDVETYRCPSLREARSGYASNARTDMLPLSAVMSPAQLVMFFDSSGGWNRAGGPEMVVFRHTRGANYGYVDGHVRWNRQDDSSWLSWDPAGR